MLFCIAWSTMKNMVGWFVYSLLFALISYFFCNKHCYVHDALSMRGQSSKMRMAVSAVVVVEFIIRRSYKVSFFLCKTGFIYELFLVHSNFATMGDLNYKENVPKCNQLSQAGNIIHLCMEYNEKIKNNGVSGVEFFLHLKIFYYSSILSYKCVVSSPSQLSALSKSDLLKSRHQHTPRFHNIVCGAVGFYTFAVVR